MADRLKYDPRGHFFRNRVVMAIALRVIGIPMMWLKEAHCERYRPKNKTFLLVANHNETIDPAYEMMSLMRYVRYVSSDHVVRKGLQGRFLNYFGSMIIKYRDRPSEELVENIKATLREGVSVGIHAEGGMSYNGESRYISPNTAKLVKEADCAVITYRSYGGYMRSPRWKKKRRKGPLYGGVVREYSREEIREMTQENVYDMLCRDLYVNAYEEQRKSPQVYEGENLAESCEIILYQCPECGQIGKLHSKGGMLSCECGYEVEMQADGFFHDCGKGLHYDNICDWEHWQREAVKAYLDEHRGRLDVPIFRDEEQILVKIVDGKDVPLSSNAILELYGDRMVISWESGSWTAPLEKIKKMDYVKWQSLLVVTEEDYFDVSAVVPRSATKYMDAWRYLTGKPNYWGNATGRPRL